MNKPLSMSRIKRIGNPLQDRDSLSRIQPTTLPQSFREIASFWGLYFSVLMADREIRGKKRKEEA